MTDDHIAKEILGLLGTRDCQSSICPSEVARLLASNGGWRQLMPCIRRVGAQLASQELIRITQGSKTVDPTEESKGPIRYRRGSNYETAANGDK